MILYIRMLHNQFKINASFRFNYILNLLFSFLFIVLKVSIWTALYKSDYTSSIHGVTLNIMVSYSIISGIGTAFTRSSVMGNLNRMILNGEITNYLLWPLGFRGYLFKSGLTESIFNTINDAMLPAIIAALVYGLTFEGSVVRLLLFIITIFMGAVINFLYKYIMGLSAIWLKNSFFLSNFDNILTNLLCGSFVPLWFFPAWLGNISNFLPFRYVLFEPTSILLGQTEWSRIGVVIFIQLLWIGILFVGSSLVWNRGQKKLFVFGG